MSRSVAVNFPCLSFLLDEQHLPHPIITLKDKYCTMPALVVTQDKLTVSILNTVNIYCYQQTIHNLTLFSSI